MRDQPNLQNTRSANIVPVEADKLVWNPSDVPGSLKAVESYAETAADNAIAWYWANKKWKARCSRAIQLGAVTSTALAGLIPVIVAIFPSLSSVFGSSTGLASSLFVGFAAALIGVDKAFGLSSGWARYVLTATTIRKALQTFRLDWALLMAQMSSPATKEEIVALLERAKEFTGLLEELVLQETKDWVTEFQNNIAQLEKETRAQLDSLKAQTQEAIASKAAASQPGSVEIVVLNVDKIDDRTFQIRWDGPQGQIAQEMVVNAQEWIRINVPTGQYIATVSATVAGKSIVKAVVINLKPGEQKKIEITLPITLAAAAGSS